MIEIDLDGGGRNIFCDVEIQVWGKSETLNKVGGSTV